MERAKVAPSPPTSVIFSTPHTATVSIKPLATARTPAWKATPPEAQAASTALASIPVQPIPWAINAPRCFCPIN